MSDLWPRFSEIELRARLKDSVYDLWRFPKVRPSAIDNTWEQRTRADRVAQLHVNYVLADILTGRLPSLTRFTPDEESSQLLETLLAEARAERGEADWTPPWELEEREFAERRPRGRLSGALT